LSGIAHAGVCSSLLSKRGPFEQSAQNKKKIGIRPNLPRDRLFILSNSQGATSGA
jgi:hypothetical protein